MIEIPRPAGIRVLVAAHLLVGTVIALIAQGYPQLQQWALLVVSYAGFVCCEILLLGMWLGLSSARSWIKLLGTLAGTGWLLAISMAPMAFRGPNRGELIVIIFVPLVVVFASSAVCRRWWA